MKLRAQVVRSFRKHHTHEAEVPKVGDVHKFKVVKIIRDPDDNQIVEVYYEDVPES
jgi:hypothetical protein